MTPAHPNDEELLLVAEREGGPERAAEIREHLAECPPCRARIAEIETTLADFISVHEDQVRSQPPLAAGLRRTLQAELANAARPSAESRPWGFSHVLARQLVAAGAAFLIVAGSLWFTRSVVLQSFHPKSSQLLAGALPRRKLTPGAVRPVRIDELCDSHSFQNDPPLSPSLEQAVFSEYGLSSSSKDGYDVDYLISPTLGGDDDIHNLWPQPHSSTTWNARVKDELEDHLHEQVCAGKLPLATAQSEIATDWIKAYKRYFNTDAPLSNAVTLVPPRLANLPVASEGIPAL